MSGNVADSSEAWLWWSGKIPFKCFCSNLVSLSGRVKYLFLSVQTGDVISPQVNQMLHLLLLNRLLKWLINAARKHLQIVLWNLTGPWLKSFVGVLFTLSSFLKKSFNPLVALAINHLYWRSLQLLWVTYKITIPFDWRNQFMLRCAIKPQIWSEYWLLFSPGWLIDSPQGLFFWLVSARQVLHSDINCTQMRWNETVMVPTRRLDWTSSVDLQVATVAPPSPWLALRFCRNQNHVHACCLGRPWSRTRARALGYHLWSTAGHVHFNSWSS